MTSRMTSGEGGISRPQLETSSHEAEQTQPEGALRQNKLGRRITSRAAAATRRGPTLRFVALAVLLAAGAVVRPSFLAEHSLMSVLLAVAPVAALSTGEAFVMIRGKFCDLSVGATASAAAVVAIWLSPHGAVVALLGALAVGLAVGLVNGFAVAVLNGNAIIVTLGMASVVSAIDLGVSGGRNLSVSNGQLSNIGSSSVAGVPLPVIITAVVVVTASIWFSRAQWGRHLALAGDNERAALIAGVSVRRSTMFAFVLCACFSAFGGYILATYVGNLNFAVEASAALPAIAGTVLGGISLFGGAGLPWYALLGAVLLGYFDNVLLVLGLSPYQEEIVEGLLVIGVVYLTERISFGRET